MFRLKTILLPRQAREQHRKTPTKGAFFCAAGRAGLQPDGATYSVLHGVWLRLGNLPQAVGALAQAKQRAEQQSAAAGSTSHRHGVMGTPPTPSAALGGALWDQIQRDEEISSRLRSLHAAAAATADDQDEHDRGGGGGGSSLQERRALRFGWLYSYFAELRRQSLASTAVYTTMLDTCRLGVEVKALLAQMEKDGIAADLETYAALHRAWVRASDLGEKTALFEPFIYKMHYLTKTGSGQT